MIFIKKITRKQFNNLFLRLLFIILLFISNPISAREININANDSSIKFNVRHIGETQVHGVFNNFTGKIHVNDGIDRIEGIVVVDSIDTNNKIRNRYLKSTKFFNVKKIPEIRYLSTEIISTNNQLISYGELSIYGVTQNISLPLIIDYASNNIKSNLSINRFDYGLLRHKKMIGATVNIALDIYTDNNIR